MSLIPFWWTDEQAHWNFRMKQNCRFRVHKLTIDNVMGSLSIITLFMQNRQKKNIPIISPYATLWFWIRPRISPTTLLWFLLAVILGGWQGEKNVIPEWELGDREARQLGHQVQQVAQDLQHLDI